MVLSLKPFDRVARCQPARDQLSFERTASLQPASLDEQFS